MAITRRIWSRTEDGRPIYKYTMTNKSGASVVLTNIGAGIVSINVPDKDGKLGDVVLGYGKAESYDLQRLYGRSYQPLQHNGNVYGIWLDRRVLLGI